MGLEDGFENGPIWECMVDLVSYDNLISNFMSLFLLCLCSYLKRRSIFDPKIALLL